MNCTRLALSLALCACHGGPAGTAADAPPPPSAPADGADASGPTAAVATRQLCKLLSNKNTSDPTANDVQHRSNVLGADLGIPVASGDTLYLLFGDTIGFAGIWGDGVSHPDAIGYGLDSTTAIAANPSLLCSDLRIISLAPASSIGPSVDSSVVADFAGGFMTAPAGHALGDFIHDPAGSSDTKLFTNLPGDFEVPSGAFASGTSIYVFYTTVASSTDLDMTASYLAKWTAPAPTAPPGYAIQYAVDERSDASGALHGHFINVSAEVSGDYVYLFGTGKFRGSPIYVARKPLASLGTPGGFEDLGQVTTTPGYGETSVRYFPEIQRWVVLGEESLPASNRIVAYFAEVPQGPWSAPVVVHDMADPAFRGHYCCAVDDDCEGEQMFDCDRTGFYGTYMLPFATAANGAVTIHYTMSSFAPYNVALFEATLPVP